VFYESHLVPLQMKSAFPHSIRLTDLETEHSYLCKLAQNATCSITHKQQENDTLLMYPVSPSSVTK